jgi:predicted Zn-dependent protease
VHHHPIKGIARQYGIDLLMKLVSGGYSDLLNTLSSGGNILLALRNGRAFEREADATGVGLLEKLGLRADGIAGFFEQMLANEPKDAASAAGIWSSHPPTQERIDATKRPTTGRPAFSDADWKALREVCK